MMIDASVYSLAYGDASERSLVSTDSYPCLHETPLHAIVWNFSESCLDEVVDETAFYPQFERRRDRGVLIARLLWLICVLLLCLDKKQEPVLFQMHVVDPRT